MHALTLPTRFDPRNAAVAVHLMSERSPSWSSKAEDQWRGLLTRAGARRVAFHLGRPWPPGWNSSSDTNEDIV